MSAPTQVLFDAPGPRTRRLNTTLSVVSVLVLLGLLAFIVWKFQDAGQLDVAKWAPFSSAVIQRTLLAGMFWVLGAALPLEWRLGLWLIAVLIDYAAPLAHYRIPGIGAAPMHQWDTDAEHLAERNRLVFIIALGESILLMGGSIVSHGQLTPGLALSLIVGFASLFVLWWNYFALAGPDTRGGDSSTGALRSAYAYAHAFMVLGAILVAVSIELRLSHDHLTPAIVVVTAAGPLVYLAGNLLFLRSRFGRLARSRFIAAAVLVGIMIAAMLLIDHVPVIALSVAVLAVTAVLAAHTAYTTSKQSALE